MLKLRPFTFLDKIYMRKRRNPKRELGKPIEIGYSEIACVDDIHADEEICARQISLQGNNARDKNVVGQPDIYHIRLYL